MPELATVDPIADNISWSAHAVGGDVIQRAPINAPVIAIWIGEDDLVKYSKANCKASDLCVFSAVIHDMAVEVLRK